MVGERILDLLAGRGMTDGQRYRQRNDEYTRRGETTFATRACTAVMYDARAKVCWIHYSDARYSDADKVKMVLNTEQVILGTGLHVFNGFITPEETQIWFSTAERADIMVDKRTGGTLVQIGEEKLG